MIRRSPPLTAVPLLLIALALLLSSGRSYSAQLQTNRQVVGAVQSECTPQIDFVIEDKSRVLGAPGGIPASGACIRWSRPSRHTANPVCTTSSPGCVGVAAMTSPSWMAPAAAAMAPFGRT